MKTRIDLKPCPSGVHTIFTRALAEKQAQISTTNTTGSLPL